MSEDGSFYRVSVSPCPTLENGPPPGGPLWRSLSRWLLFETRCGLLILFLPFGLTPQFTVVVHTGVGCLFLLPYLIYQVQLWSTHLSSAWTHVKLTEYVAFGAAMVCVVSG
ncbi:MAG: hypothetical protein VYB08_08540, partial [Candidatus Latescibacterota bacterium]|nr:hypothetical protein [Candidatus Latescibacterota bacterium]